jgi:hypothetical protein
MEKLAEKEEKKPLRSDDAQTVLQISAHINTLKISKPVTFKQKWWAVWTPHHP